MNFEDLDDAAKERIIVDATVNHDVLKVGIPKDELEVGAIYRVDGRNLDLAFWNGVGFEGVRRKFGQHYIDTEFHYDDGAPNGTCIPLLKLNIDY